MGVSPGTRFSQQYKYLYLLWLDLVGSVSPQIIAKIIAHGFPELCRINLPKAILVAIGMVAQMLDVLRIVKIAALVAAGRCLLLEIDAVRFRILHYRWRGCCKRRISHPK